MFDWDEWKQFKSIKISTGKILEWLHYQPNPVVHDHWIKSFLCNSSTWYQSFKYMLVVMLICPNYCSCAYLRILPVRLVMWLVLPMVLGYLATGWVEPEPWPRICSWTAKKPNRQGIKPPSKQTTKEPHSQRTKPPTNWTAQWRAVWIPNLT